MTQDAADPGAPARPVSRPRRRAGLAARPDAPARPPDRGAEDPLRRAMAMPRGERIARWQRLMAAVRVSDVGLWGITTSRRCRAT